MHLPAQSFVGVPPRNGGVLTRTLDFAVIALGALVAARFERLPDGGGYDSALLAFALLVSALVFPLFGLYRIGHRRIFVRCICAPVLAWLLSLVVALVVVVILGDPWRPDNLRVLRWTLFSGTGLVLVRLVACVLSRRRERHIAGSRAVAIVGSGEHCRQLLRKIESTPNSRWIVSTIFDTGLDMAAAPGAMPAFHDRSGFAEYVRRYQVKELWLALPLSEERTILDFIELFRRDLVNIRFIPDVSGMALFEGEMIKLEGASAINLVGSPLSSDALVIKDRFDRAFALCALTMLCPLLIAIALAVKISSPGPVLFTQKRKGANGRIFEIYKFRSMRIHQAAHGVVKQATRNDPRITRVGAFLRRTSLDELPQFLNVLRGDMSVVGPRPHAIEHDTLYQNIVDGYIHRYRIKPGITGWAQVNGFRGETDRIEKMEGRVEHDLFYLSNWSFGLDMRIIVATIFKGLVHRNAY
ncbi:undecaprenyl-phosphate glucose phosphotransferase [Paraburkholderia acidisoli]|uniref:Undecaprenyl-phosphate glucose phosphotransferase n=1 Tax=Paraburkholderia acidisoli TaxID=2571748 RepID=A0A7Z2GJJ1_9BURK|nr:undecaprenyl-phosphate glucose phosphotransferase [Paraburkholderia acidisoli]QGZ62970.1 undecaprenyl-phosphate glucose phosphotransferase [Paraburkholderia acidisoli]